MLPEHKGTFQPLLTGLGTLVCFYSTTQVGCFRAHHSECTRLVQAVLALQWLGMNLI